MPWRRYIQDWMSKRRFNRLENMWRVGIGTFLCYNLAQQLRGWWRKMSKRRQRNKVPYIKPVPTKAISSTLVDIITPVYGRFDLLKRCLESIPAAAKDISYHIILIDNNSPNKEEADVFYNEIKIQKNTRIVRNKGNLGFPKACNQAVRLSHSPLLFFLNSDVILFEDAIKNLVLAMDDPNSGAVGMKLLFPPDTESGPDGKAQHIGLYTNINGGFV